MLTQDKIAALKAAHGPALALRGRQAADRLPPHGPCKAGAASAAGPTTLEVSQAGEAAAR